MVSAIIVIGLVVSIQSLLIAMLWIDNRNLQYKNQRQDIKIKHLYKLISLLEAKQKNKTVPILDQDYRL